MSSLPTITGPTVLRRQLGRRLQRLRMAAGKSEADVEEAGVGGRTKLWRIEQGKVPVRVPDVRTLCWLYGADAETTEALAAMAMGTNRQGWWEGNEVPAWFGLYVGLEATATEILTYDLELVHGLLQTEAYARAVTEATVPNATPDDVEARVRVRLERQKAMARVPAPKLVSIIGPGALRRQVGGPKVMKHQAARLHAAVAEGADIRVLPWEVGAHSGLGAGAFTLLDFADGEDPSVVYVESITGARYLERPDEVREYRRIFQDMHRQSTPLEEME